MPKRLDLRIAGVVLLLTMLLFVPSLGGGFVSDDLQLVVQDRRVGDPTRLWELLSSPFWSFDVDQGSMDAPYARIHRPMVKLAFVLGHRIGGGRAFGFHLVALATHLGVVALAIGFLRRRVTSPWVVLPAAALFALHPSRVESVAWISGLSDTLMALFSLLAARLAAATTVSRASRWAGLFLLGFAAAASKEPGLLVAPFVVAVEEGTAKRTRREGVIGPLATFAGALLAIGIGQYVGRDVGPMPFHLDLVKPLATVGAAIVRLVWPVPITLMPMPTRFREGGHLIVETPYLIVGVVVLLAGFGTMAASVRRPAARPFALAFALTLLGYLLVLGFDGRPTATWISDRFSYVPLLGPASMLAAALDRLADPARRTASLASCLLAALCIPATVQGVAVFHDDATFAEHELRLRPDQPQQISVRARRELSNGDVEAAMRDIWLAVESARRQHLPDGSWGYQVVAMSMRVGGTPDRELPETRGLRDALVGLAREGRIATRVDGHDVAFRLSDGDLAMLRRRPEVLHVPIAVLSMRLRELGTAARWAGEAARIAPRLPDAWLTWLTALARAGRFEEARATLARARASIPHHPEFFRGFEAALARAEAIAATPAEGEEGRARRAASVAEALMDPSGVLLAFGPRCGSGLDPSVTARCASAAAATGDTPRAISFLEARARVAPEESAAIAQAIATLRSPPSTRRPRPGL